MTLPAREVAPAAAFYRQPGFVSSWTRSLGTYASSSRTARAPVIFLECQNLDGTVERLAAAGIQFDSPGFEAFGEITEYKPLTPP